MKTKVKELINRFMLLILVHLLFHGLQLMEEHFSIIPGSTTLKPIINAGPLAI